MNKTRNLATILHLATILLILNLSACSSNGSKIAEVDVEGGVILHSSPNFQGYFYQGSDSNFHYFVSRWKHVKDKRFKLSNSEVYLNEPFQFETNEQAIDLLKTQAALGKETTRIPYIFLE
ncbi:hypothetical protein ACFQZJ_15420 [Maribacter chungangensis]|uniref:Uncharacterized protein n=1 Tax=Maribacter chungangensis TaxID=1069117 RepID=A0ABW3B705_9FLAO